MEISDVRVKLIHNSADRLKAVCTVTFDEEFVVRDVKVVEGTNGMFVAMPSRKLSIHCPKCRHKNHLRSRFCNDCGARLPAGAAPVEGDGRTRMHRDIAHPITTEFREQLQARVIEAYHAEYEQARDPNYVPPDLEEVVEPVEEAVSVEPRGEMTEYDSIIAGLRGGIRESPDRSNVPASRGRDSDRDRPSEAGNDRSQGRGRPPRGRGEPAQPVGRGREQRPPVDRFERPPIHQGGHGRSQEQLPVERHERSEAEVPVSARREAEQPPQRRTDERPERKVVNTIEPAKPQPAPKPKPVPVKNDDDGGFGAGLL